MWIVIMHLDTGEVFKHNLTRFEESIIQDHAEDWLRANDLDPNMVSYMTNSNEPKIKKI